MNYTPRIETVRQKMQEGGVSFLFVTNTTNVRYLCGFSGSNGSILLGTDDAHFFSDGRYETQAGEQVEGAEIFIYATPDEFQDALRKSLGTDRAKVAFEASHVSVLRSPQSGDGRPSVEELEGYFESHELVPSKGWVEEIRRVKDDGEIRLIKAAAELADAGFAHIVERVKVGKTERELALELEFFMRKSGADGVSFELIVAAGERSALPHARPTDKSVEKGRYLLFDLGCKVDGYCSDLTRTVIVGSADERHREIYDLVLKAEEASLAAVRSGVTGLDLDQIARDIITDGGYRDAFSHGLGHGVGLDVHEDPRLSRISKDTLQAGNVVTVEPGVYLAGWGGVRIEDLVYVQAQGSEVLSAAPKELLVL